MFTHRPPNHSLKRTEYGRLPQALGGSWRAKIKALHFGHVTASSLIVHVARFMSMPRGLAKHNAVTLP
jgi:hypothetical protein